MGLEDQEQFPFNFDEPEIAAKRFSGRETRGKLITEAVAAAAFTGWIPARCHLTG